MKLAIGKLLFFTWIDSVYQREHNFMQEFASPVAPLQSSPAPRCIYYDSLDKKHEIKEKDCKFRD